MARKEITKEQEEWIDKMLERAERLEKIIKLKEELGKNEKDK